MEIVSILLIAALGLVAGAYVLQPLLVRGPGGGAPVDKRSSELKAERDRVLDVLKELDMDHSMGKVTPEDYAAQRQALVTRGAVVLRQLDALDHTDGLERELEAAVTAERSDSPDLEQELEAAIAAARSSAGVICGECGSPTVAGDKFCAHCGATLEELKV